MGEPLGKLFYALWNEVVWLNVKWKEYLELYGTKKTRIELMNRAAPGFFKLLQDVLLEDIILHITRLTDPPESGRNARKTHLTIKQLLRHIENKQVADSVHGLIKRADKAAKFCRDWRDRRIAHRELQLALKEGGTPLALASITKISTAISAIVEVMHTVEFQMTGRKSIYNMGVTPAAMVMQLLSVIDSGLIVKEEKLKKMRDGNFNPEDFKLREI